MADQELMTLLNNIVSLVGQAKQTVAGGEPEEAPAEGGGEMDMEAIKKYMKEMEGSPEDKKEDEGEKKVEKSEESPSPDDKNFAEQNLDEQPEVNEKNVKDVAKAIIAAMKAQKSVAKAKPVSEIAELTKVIKALADRTIENEKALDNVLAGLGIADEVKKSVEVKKSESEKRPVAVSDVAELKKSLELILGAKNESPSMVGVNAEPHKLAKSLTENGGQLLHAIFPRHQ